MKSKNYFLQRNHDCTRRLNLVLQELPCVCREFFVGIESSTTPLTRLNYAYDLRRFFDFAISFVPAFANLSVNNITFSDLDRLTTVDIEQYLSYLSYYAPSESEIVSNSARGKARKLSTLRAFFKHFVRKGKLQNNVAANVATPKIQDNEIIRLEPDEVESLLNLVEYGDVGSEHQVKYNRKTKLRDLAMLTLFLGTGIRISELVGLNIEDIDLKNKAFNVTRKGGGKATLYFPEEVYLTLLSYWEERLRDSKVPPTERGLFVSIQGQRITVRAVENVVKKFSRQINPLKKITPHKLRSTFGTELYQSTKDIYLVADVLGHKDVNTTRKHYAALSDENRRAAAKMINLRKNDDKKNEEDIE